jgi:sugar/nucleoside kinase (ribokinase family)
VVRAQNINQAGWQLPRNSCFAHKIFVEASTKTGHLLSHVLSLLMDSDKIVISGIGCALLDLIYNGTSFDSPNFRKYISRKDGDGGLSPGKLVFAEELEHFSGESYAQILRTVVRNRQADTLNVGGPSLVSLILAAQLLNTSEFAVKFYGIAGDDANGGEICKKLRQTPLDISNYNVSNNRPTPTTDVFSDPNYDHGHGERTFVNNIGAAWDYLPKHIPDDFFEADITCFGGTALVPAIHDHLTGLLSHARKHNCITVVNTVFDFRNQKKNPDLPWPLVDRIEDYSLIDVLIMDREEALKISGQDALDAAVAFFMSTTLSSFIITNGADHLWAGSNGGLFQKAEATKFPISNRIAQELKSHPGHRGDTTGCGDNFAGGIISSVAMQLKNRKKGQLNFTEAISWGVSAGGNCCFTVGGTYLEAAPFELRNKIQEIREDFIRQIGGQK